MIVWVGVKGKKGPTLKYAQAVDVTLLKFKYSLRAICGKWIYKWQLLHEDIPAARCPRCVKIMESHNKRFY